VLPVFQSIFAGDDRAAQRAAARHLAALAEAVLVTHHGRGDALRQLWEPLIASAFELRKKSMQIGKAVSEAVSRLPASIRRRSGDEDARAVAQEWIQQVLTETDEYCHYEIGEIPAHLAKTSETMGQEGRKLLAEAVSLARQNLEGDRDPLRSGTRKTLGTLAHAARTLRLPLADPLTQEILSLFDLELKRPWGERSDAWKQIDEWLLLLGEADPTGTALLQRGAPLLNDFIKFAERDGSGGFLILKGFSGAVFALPVSEQRAVMEKPDHVADRIPCPGSHGARLTPPGSYRPGIRPTLAALFQGIRRRALLWPGRNCPCACGNSTAPGRFA